MPSPENSNLFCCFLAWRLPGSLDRSSNGKALFALFAYTTLCRVLNSANLFRLN
jgi:hypothetical protein